MTGLPALSNFSEEQLDQMALKVKCSYDISLPKLKWYNYSPCESHETNTDGCRKCGLLPRRHQRVGSTWLYVRPKALLSDPTGSGKTCHAALLLAMIKESGELQSDKKVIVVCRAAAVRQWVSELNRMLPNVRVLSATGTLKQRLAKYTSDWEVMVMSKEMILSDVEALEQFKLHMMIIDDVDSLRNRSNRQAYAIKRHARRCERVVLMTATPMHKRLHELHSVLEPIGGVKVLGNEFRFKARYIQSQKVQIIKRNGDKVNVTETVGYKNIDELRQRIAPLVLRRTVAEMDDVSLPAVVMNTVWLDLHPQQRAEYEELRKGVVALIKNGEAEIKRIEALQKVLYGSMICSGLAALGREDGPGASSKLDWVMDKLEDDFEDEKVVIFINNKNQIRALQARLNRAGIKFVTVWGEESKPELRQKRIDQFWDDPETKVLLGTSSIEQSINLQVARQLIFVDTILNPARMTQLAGRVRRQGSEHRTVYLHHLLSEDTHEFHYPQALAREQAVTDKVFDENSDIFEALSPLEILQMFQGV